MSSVLANELRPTGPIFWCLQLSEISNRTLSQKQPGQNVRRGKDPCSDKNCTQISNQNINANSKPQTSVAGPFYGIQRPVHYYYCGGGDILVDNVQHL